MDSVKWPSRMNPTDALFWSMDKVPELRSTVGALMITERMPSRERIRQEFDRLSYHLPRMRQRVVEVPFGLAPPEWIEDAQFDLDYHLRYVAIPAPGGMAELLAEMSPLFATALDRDRPLWETYVADGLMGGRGAVFIKMHHCITDGVGGSRLFGGLLGDRVQPDGAEAPRPLSAPRSDSVAAMLWRAAGYNVRDALETSATVLGALTAAALNPQATLRDLRHALRTLTGFTRELLVPRARSPLHRQRSLSRQLSTFEMSLTQVDAVGKRLDATINDVVLTIVAGALHRWHTSHGADVHELRATVPVNLRSAADAHAGNRLALLAVGLPVGEPNPLRRLRQIQERMGRVKLDRRATMYPLLARMMVAMPFAVAKQLGRQQTRRTNFVCTNVPGPARVCYLAGEAIEGVYAYAPLVGDHPVAIALYSYRDTLFVGLDVDPMAMRDLPHFRDALAESYAEVLSVGRPGDTRSARRPPRRAVRAHPRRLRRSS